MNAIHTSRVIALAGRLLGRALIGAVAGLVVVSLALVIASERFGLFTFKEPVTADRYFQSADRYFQSMAGLGAVAFAVLAVVSGKTEIGGRTGAAIKGVLTGVAVGVVAGFACGFLIGSIPEGGIPQKAALGLGIFLGGPLGAIGGGIVGTIAGGHAETTTAAERSGSEDVQG
jgi:hypothetical protein